MLSEAMFSIPYACGALSAPLQALFFSLGLSWLGLFSWSRDSNLNTSRLVVGDVPDLDGLIRRSSDEAVRALAGQAEAVDALVVSVQRPDGLVVHPDVKHVHVALVSADLK